MAKSVDVSGASLARAFALIALSGAGENVLARDPRRIELEDRLDALSLVTNNHGPRDKVRLPRRRDVTHIDTPKPQGKRAKRRARGKVVAKLREAAAKARESGQ